jgi:AraC-like DNA-binding protein
MANRRIASPELELEPSRVPELGYEVRERQGSLRYLQHGFPTPLVRWHHHEEYELHLIVASHGKAFVGDYIGFFEPGHLVLTGPNLPHNWITTDVPPGGYALRDMVLQFCGEPLRRSAEFLPEIDEALPMLERARHGIEFFSISDAVCEHMRAIRELSGLQRLARFATLLSELAACKDYRLLSVGQLRSTEDDASMHRINGIVEFVLNNFCSELSMAEIAARVSMTESTFSRYFRRATGNTFTDFVNRLRINKACMLLMESDRYISNVCYDVGFNNVAYFNRRFLQFKGMTPKEFRRQALARFGTPQPQEWKLPDAPTADAHHAPLPPPAFLRGH